MRLHASRSGTLGCISVSHDDIEWVQLIDYEHVPFRFRRCHALGQLFKDCHLVPKPSPIVGSDSSGTDGFTNVTNRRKNHKKQASNARAHLDSSFKPPTWNSFKDLAHQNDTSLKIPAPIETKVMKVKPQRQANPKGSQTDPLFKGVSTSEKQKAPVWNKQGMNVDNLNSNTRLAEEEYEEFNETQIMEEETEAIYMGELDIPGLEQACITNNFENIPDRQVENLEEILNQAQRKKSLGI